MPCVGKLPAGSYNGNFCAVREALYSRVAVTFITTVAKFRPTQVGTAEASVDSFKTSLATSMECRSRSLSCKPR